MTPRRVIVEVADNGDLLIYTLENQLVARADWRPIPFGGTGLSGIISGIQHALSHNPDHKGYIIPTRGSDPGTPEDIARRRINTLYNQARDGKEAMKGRSRARYSKPAGTPRTQTTTATPEDLGF